MDWKDFFNEESKKEYFKDLMNKVNNAYNNGVCYPLYDNIFNAFKLTPLENVKVVILGQDPYHEENQAHGLSFSVLCKKLPPSLKNIYKEMSLDLGVEVKQDGDLTYLAKQGVLLLNATLSVEEGKANSHKDFGWQTLTDNVLKYLNELDKNIVYILWGNNARSKTTYLINKKQFIIESAHPSPLSAYNGFFGSKPFSKCNKFLRDHNIEEINWIKGDSHD